MESQPIDPYKKFLGLRLSAIWETLLFLFILCLCSYLFGDGDRYITYKFHPFWIIVLLTASLYGTAEGIFAALVSTFALYFGNIPLMQADQTLFDYELQIGLLPMLWISVAFVLGEIRSTVDWRMKSLYEEALHADSKAERIASEFTSLKEQNQQLSLSLSSKEETVSSAFEVFRELESVDPGQVILGLNSIIELSLRPKKFSVYAMGTAGLEAVTGKGWTEEDHYTRRFTQETTLYHAMIEERRLISVINKADQKLLGVEGVLAAPLIDPDSQNVFGMIKVEEIEFQNLNLIRIESFKTVCELIGKAYANSKEYKKLQEESIYSSKGLYSYTFYGALSVYLNSLAKEFKCHLADFTLQCRIRDLKDADIAELKKQLPPSTLLFHGQKNNELLLLKPMLPSETLESIKLQIIKALEASSIQGKEQIKIIRSSNG